MWLAHLKSKAEGTAESSVKQVPLPERHERTTDQWERLRGVRLQGSKEPSRPLVDMVAQMRQNSSFRYIDPIGGLHKQTTGADGHEEGPIHAIVDE
eukprot:4771311-Amphidinium_carterae.1